MSHIKATVNGFIPSQRYDAVIQYATGVLKITSDASTLKAAIETAGNRDADRAGKRA